MSHTPRELVKRGESYPSEFFVRINYKTSKYNSTGCDDRYKSECCLYIAGEPKRTRLFSLLLHKYRAGLGEFLKVIII